MSNAPGGPTWRAPAGRELSSPAGGEADRPIGTPQPGRGASPPAIGTPQPASGASPPAAGASPSAIGASRVAIVGLRRSGLAVARACVGAGVEVLAVDDSPEEAGDRAAAAGIRLLGPASPDVLATLASWAELVVVSPGVPAGHPVFSLAGRLEVVSEIEFGARLVRVPMVAVTGTNGKTTVVTLVERMLAASGRDALAAGNIGRALTEAALSAAEILVVEVSSFQLAFSTTFAAHVAGWLNVAPDHLDWHGSFERYVAAKARLFANQTAQDVAVVGAEDPTVVAATRALAARLVSFGRGGDWRVEDGALRAPDGREIVAVTSMQRRSAVDQLNGLAASALASEAGGSLDAARRVLEEFSGLPHRVERVAEVAGVAYYNDSKATTPDAVVAAVRGFSPGAAAEDSEWNEDRPARPARPDRPRRRGVVLIAGGRSKGVSLDPLAALGPDLVGVVTIGEAAGAVEAVFASTAGLRIRRAASMAEAVAAAAELAVPGDVVLLSPGCASFDWYSSYGARGDDFRNEVARLAGRSAR